MVFINQVDTILTLSFVIYESSEFTYTIMPNVVKMPENQSSNPIALYPLCLGAMMTASINTHQPMASYLI